MTKDKTEGQQELFPEYSPPKDQNQQQGDIGPSLIEGKYQVTAIEYKTTKFGEMALLTLRDGSVRHTFSSVLVPQLKGAKPPVTLNVNRPSGKRYYTLV